MKEITNPLSATGMEYNKERNQYLRTERRPSWGRDWTVALLFCVSPEVGESREIVSGTEGDQLHAMSCTLYKKFLVFVLVPSKNDMISPFGRGFV